MTCVAALLLAVLAPSPASADQRPVAPAEAASETSAQPAAKPIRLTRLIAREAERLAERASAAQDVIHFVASQRPQFRPRPCASVVGRTLVAAAIGAAIAGGVAFYVERRLSGIRPGVVAGFAAAGGGIGALVGYVSCR